MTLTDQEIRRRVQTLPERYQDRLPQDYPRLSGDRDSGELEEVVENLVAGLRQDQAPVSSRERDELAQLLDAMTLPRISREWLDDLRVIPSLTPQQLPDRARTLPERYAARIPADERRRLTIPRDAGDWDDLVENLVELLRKHQVAISSQERTELWLILDAVDLPRQELSQLPVI